MWLTAVFMTAGYYGTSDSESFSEASRPGGDYLAEVCREWEDVANAAEVGLSRQLWQSRCHHRLLHGRRPDHRLPPGCAAAAGKVDC